jgi:hypothetical protein
LVPRRPNSAPAKPDITGDRCARRCNIELQQSSLNSSSSVIVLGCMPYSNNRDHPLQSRLWMNVMHWKERHGAHSKAVKKAVWAKRMSFPPWGFPGQALSIVQAWLNCCGSCALGGAWCCPACCCPRFGSGAPKVGV